MISYVYAKLNNIQKVILFFTLDYFDAYTVPIIIKLTDKKMQNCEPEQIKPINLFFYSFQ